MVYNAVWVVARNYREFIRFFCTFCFCCCCLFVWVFVFVCFVFCVFFVFFFFCFSTTSFVVRSKPGLKKCKSFALSPLPKLIWLQKQNLNKIFLSNTPSKTIWEGLVWHFSCELEQPFAIVALISLFSLFLFFSNNHKNVGNANLWLHQSTLSPKKALFFLFFVAPCCCWTTPCHSVMSVVRPVVCPRQDPPAPGNFKQLSF